MNANHNTLPNENDDSAYVRLRVLRAPVDCRTRVHDALPTADRRLLLLVTDRRLLLLTADRRLLLAR